MKSIKDILMKRDGLTALEAEELIRDAKQDFSERMANEEDASDICEEWFGLEPDYIFDLIDA